MATKKRRRSSKAKRGGISTTHILIVAGAAVLVFGLLVVLNINRSQSSVTGVSYETGITSDGEPYKGWPNAPIQVVEYSDFLCGHCGDFADALHALGPDYIETGKVQVIFRNYAFLAPESIQAAQAAECALDQSADKFWLYHDLLFANRGTGLAAYSKPRLNTYAREVGLDTGAFKDCLDSGTQLAEVESDRAEGQSQGVESTPTWFLNEQMIRGALPQSELRQMFEAQLSRGS